MELQPQAALDAIVNVLKRIPISPAEAIGVQRCIDVLSVAITPQPPVKSE